MTSRYIAVLEFLRLHPNKQDRGRNISNELVTVTEPLESIVAPVTIIGETMRVVTDQLIVHCCQVHC